MKIRTFIVEQEQFLIYPYLLLTNAAEDLYTIN